MPQLREGGEARMAKAGMTVADMLNRRDRQGMVERLIAAETDPERVLCPIGLATSFWTISGGPSLLF